MIWSKQLIHHCTQSVVHQFTHELWTTGQAKVHTKFRINMYCLLSSCLLMTRKQVICKYGPLFPKRQKYPHKQGKGILTINGV